MMRRVGRAVLVVAALAGCGGDDGTAPPPPPPPPSGPGSISFGITVSPGADHGALLITVTGGAVDSVTGLAGYEVFQSLTTSGARAMVFGAIVDGPLLRLWVPDLGRGDGYMVQVNEGAVRGTYGTVAPDAYQITRTP